jgi:hypothetical protein
MIHFLLCYTHSVNLYSNDRNQEGEDASRSASAPPPNQ